MSSRPATLNNSENFLSQGFRTLIRWSPESLSPQVAFLGKMLRPSIKADSAHLLVRPSWSPFYSNKNCIFSNVLITGLERAAVRRPFQGSRRRNR
jgi:hypothetical protein